MTHSKSQLEKVQKSQLKIAQLEKQQLLKECNYLLRKIANHRYFLKLLRAAQRALKIISEYKK